ncbi:MAG: hypothetical protein LBI15_05180 [Dysgonamonadaceae bacterium]|nr:hypothetical protein [Dysgonamonadaceae bacterium]
MTRRFPSGETQSNEFVYDEWGNLVSLHYYENGVYRARHTLRFTKVGNRINVVSASWFFEPGSYSSYIILNEQGFAESQETTFQGDWSAKKKFLYHHENSNLIRMEEEDTYNDVYGGRNHTFTYDSYKSPFYYCETPKWVFTLFYREWWSFGINAIQNNITERNYPNPIEYEYLYNSSGLPFERIGGDTVTRYRYKNNIIKQ